MCQSVVGKLTRFFAIAVSIAVTSTSKRRRKVMKKSTQTPDPATPDQKPEANSTRAINIPAVPVKLLSDREALAIAYYNSPEDDVLRAKGAPPGNFTWIFMPSDIAGTYYIKSYTSEIFIEGKSNGFGDIIVTNKKESAWQLWRVEPGDPGDRPDEIYIHCLGDDRVMTSMGGETNGLVCLRPKGLGNVMRKQHYKIVT